MSHKSYNFIDLFCGCGGFSHGLEMAGHKCLLGVDFDKEAIRSFAQNHPHANHFHGDISKLSKAKLLELLEGKDIDVVIGGPPCQGFSTVGKGQASDERNQLFKQFVRVVKILKPHTIMFENVTGILAKKNHKVLKNIFSHFERLGYNMDARVLSSEEYGVPEIRRRAIIIGSKSTNITYPQPTHGIRGSKKLVSVKSAFKKLKSSSGEAYNHDISAAILTNKVDEKRLSFIPAGRGIRYEKDEKAYLPKRYRYQIDWNAIREKRFRQTKLLRLPLDKPSPTILTARTSYYHPVESRYLTPREAAACQSFPNDFLFHGSQTAIFRQIGNAVPPLLGKALGEEIKKFKISKKVTKKKYQENNLLSSKAFSYKEMTYL